MNRTYRAPLHGLVVVAAAGCTVPVSQNPLVDPADAVRDLQLFGTYRTRDCPDNIAHYVHIGPAESEAPEGVFRFVSVGQPLDPATPLESLRGFGFTLDIGGYEILQVPIFAPAVKLSDTRFIRASGYSRRSLTAWRRFRS